MSQNNLSDNKAFLGDATVQNGASSENILYQSQHVQVQSDMLQRFVPRREQDIENMMSSKPVGEALKYGYLESRIKEALIWKYKTDKQYFISFDELLKAMQLLMEDGIDLKDFQSMSTYAVIDEVNQSEMFQKN